VIRLLSSEALRFRSRRLVKVLMILAIIGAMVAAALAAMASSKPSDDELARAQTQRQAVIERCVRKDGFQDAFGPRPSGQSLQDYCSANIDASEFLSSDPVTLGELDEYVKAAGFIVIVIGLVIGASMVGASWQTGTITTILTWEPRRIRWLLARLVVTAVGVFAITVVLLAVLAAALALATVVRGSTATEPGWFGDLVSTVARVSAVASAIALVGGAVATIGRNTAAALGAVFVYLALLESLLRGFRPALSRFMFGDSAVVLISGNQMEVPDGSSIVVLTQGQAYVVIAAWVALLVAVALVMLRVRDVN
jgi:hypothetical protein